MQAFKSHKRSFSAVFMRGEYFFVALFFVLLWGAILGGSGSLFSGYHLADDHEILTIQEDLLLHPSGGVWAKWFWHDFEVMHRFRPFYFMQRIMLTKWLGTNFTAWLFYTGILAVFTTFLLYCGGRLTGFSIQESFLFALLSLLGKQAVIWWSLGPNENIALFFMALSWVCMLLALSYPSYGYFFRFAMVVSAMLSALSKESFLLMIPALIFLTVWMYRIRKKTTWLKAWTENLLSSISFVIFLICIMLVIGFTVGFHGYGPQGGGLSHFDPLLFIRTAIGITLSFSTVGVGLIILFCAILLLAFFSKRLDRNIVKGAVPSLILFGLIAMPQFLIYMRCGIFGRYILPLMLAYTGLLAAFLRFLKKNESRFCFIQNNFTGFFAAMACGFIILVYELARRGVFKQVFRPLSGHLFVVVPAAVALFAGFFLLFVLTLRHSRQNLSLYRVGFCLALLLVMTKLILSFGDAKAFAQHGKDTQAFFALIVNRTEQKEFIIFAIDHKNLKSEAAYSIKEYLRLKGGRDHVSFFVAPLFSGTCLPHDDGKASFDAPPCVVIFSDLEDDFLRCPPAWFSKKNYERVQNGVFISYFLKKPNEIPTP